eukprot:365601-Chlamydomonas_euryale.AAC.9
MVAGHTPPAFCRTRRRCETSMVAPQSLRCLQGCELARCPHTLPHPTPARMSAARCGTAARAAWGTAASS